MGSESTTASGLPRLGCVPVEPHVSEPAPWREVFRGRDGRLVVGLLLFETLGAVHILVVAAVMPAVLRDLGNLPLYGWAFSAAALAMIGTIPIVGARPTGSGRSRSWWRPRRCTSVGCWSRRSRRRWRCSWWGGSCRGGQRRRLRPVVGNRRQDAGPVGPAAGAGADGHLLAAPRAARPADRRPAGRFDRLAMGVRGPDPIPGAVGADDLPGAARRRRPGRGTGADLPRPRPDGRHRDVPDGGGRSIGGVGGGRRDRARDRPGRAARHHRAGHLPRAPAERRPPRSARSCCRSDSHQSIRTCRSC